MLVSCIRAVYPPRHSIVLAAILASISVVHAADIPEGELSPAEISAIVRQQAAELAAQRDLIEQQQTALESQRATIELQQQELAQQREALSALQSKAAPLAGAAAVSAAQPDADAARPGASAAGAAAAEKGTATAGPAVSPPAIAAGTVVAAGSASGTGTSVATTPGPQPVPAPEGTTERQAVVAGEQDDDPLLGYDPKSFPGSIPLPGQRAALRIGGFVKANAVESFEALGTPDRFIVGSIPTENSKRGDSEADLTANQSRLNFDLRENTDLGQFRAFIEGDFAGSGNTFRLRHAFGQFYNVLAGQTWSTFMDTEASPEELDFEGINGRINVRHTQFRYFPSYGKEWNLAVAIEEPDLAVDGGTGLSQIPDLVVSARRGIKGFWTDREWHVKAAALYRGIRARPETNDSQTESATGWGLSLSGSTPIHYWDDRDNVMLQFNYGEGYSSYVNDLSTIGLPDVAFDPLTGELVAIRAFAWYAAYQHWWRESLRSNFIVSNVDVSTEDFIVDDDYGNNYQDTWRLSTNLIWSPIPRINVGGEFLWGKRQNNDGSTSGTNGTATQLQFSLKYLF